MVGLREYYTKFVKDLTLLVEVGRHLQNCDECRDGMVVRFELLIENADTVPELRILNVLQRVQSMLIGIEALL